MSYQLRGIPAISLRHLKALLYVARTQNLTRAARKLNRSQTAITKAIKELEAQLGTPLFSRSPAGMDPTAACRVLVKWVEQVEAEFLAAEALLIERAKTSPLVRRRTSGSVAGSMMELSYKRLAVIVALHDTKEVGAAAMQLGVTSAAVYSSLRLLEQSFGISLFERSPQGFSGTALCNTLVRHLKLAFSQLRNGLDEHASLNGVVSGRLVIGTLPYARTILIPRTINTLLESYPGLKIATQEGPYELLESELRSGDIDMIVGAIRTSTLSHDLVATRLFDDRLAVIARKGHPLEAKKGLSFAKLMAYPWVLPAQNSPSRLIFDQLLERECISPPVSLVETSSLSNVRGLLLESDRLALLSEHQILYEKKHGLLIALPLELKGSYRPIGYTVRVNTPASSAAELFLDVLKKVSESLVNHSGSIPLSS